MSVNLFRRPRLRRPYMLAAWPGIGYVATSVAMYIKKALRLEFNNMRRWILPLLSILSVLSLSITGCDSASQNLNIAHYTLTISPNQLGGWGSTSPGLGTHTYKRGENVTITATPNDGSLFIGWDGDRHDQTPTIVIEQIHSNINLIPCFVQAAPYLETKKQATAISLVSSGATYGGDNAFLTARLTLADSSFSLDSSDHHLISFSLEGRLLGSISTDIMDIAHYNLSLAGINAGTYEVSASYDGNDKYKSSIGKSTLIVEAADTGISNVYAKQTYGGMDWGPESSLPGVTAALSYWSEHWVWDAPLGAVANGGAWTPLSGKGIKFYCEGKYLGSAQTNSSGVAAIPAYYHFFNSYNVGNYEYFINAIFDDNDPNYFSSEGEGNLTVKKVNSGMKGTTDQGPLDKLGRPLELRVQLCIGQDTTGGRDYNKSGNTITLFANGKVYTSVTDSHGIASFPFERPNTKGEYSSTYTFNGDDNTYGSSYTQKRTID